MDIPLVTSYYHCMTQDSAVRILVGLVPEIEKSGATKVLTDYAVKEDLPAAQLEKLGHVFNTLRTVSHIDNAPSDSRGEAVPLVDVPLLVTGYATGMSQEKAATAPTSMPTHDPARVDLLRAVRQEAAPAQEIQKAASAAEIPDSRIKVTVDEVADALLDVEHDLRAEMGKYAAEILNRAARNDAEWDRDISEMERDACYISSPGQIKAAGDWLEKFAKPHHFNIIRHDFTSALIKRAFAAETVGGGLMTKLANAAAAYDVITKMAADPTTTDEVEAKREAAGLADELDIETPSTGDNLDDDGNPPFDSMAGAEETAPTGSTEALDDVLNSAKDDVNASNAPPAEAQEKKQKGDAKTQGGDTKTGTGGATAAQKIVGMIKSPLAAAGRGIRGAASKTDETLTRITGKERQNTEQRQTDMSVEDIKRSINIRRMIGTDAVLREHNPADVLEVYNSVTALNPELAGNMPALKLLLREAVSYDGVTLDSAKGLTDIRKNQLQSDGAESDNDKRRYAVGGVNLPVNLT